jgi:exonuclease I
MEEPKRKRERKKQQHGSSKRTATTSTQQQQPPSMLHACKPILPAQHGNYASSTQSHHSNKHHWPSSLVTIKPEPTDYSSALTCLDGNSYNADTKNPEQSYHGNSDRKDTATTNASTTKTSAVDAHSKRQERLIKNRAAALLSRKRKREHLQALEQERQWLVKDNEVLKSKTATLEAKVQQLEQENEAQKQQVLLLQQQQPQQISLDEGYSSTMDPLSKVTNVLMVRSWRIRRYRGRFSLYSWS